MRTVGTGLLAEQSANVTKPGHLVRIFFPSLTVCFSSRQGITYQGVDFVARGLRVPNHDQSMDGTASITVAIANWDLAISTLVLSDGFAGVGMEVLAWWGDTFTDGVTEVWSIFNGQGSDADIGPDEVVLTATMAKLDLIQFPNTPRINAPLFNSVLPAGYQITWGNERYTLNRG